MRQRLALVFLLAAAVAAGTWSAVPLLAWRLEASLTRSLPAASVNVHLWGGPSALIGGRFPRARLLVRRAPAGGLTVHEFDAQLEGVRLAVAQAVFFGRFLVERLDAGRIVVRIREDDLRAALEQRRYVEGARVQFDNGTVSIRGTVTVAGTRAEASVHGTVVVRDEREIVLRVRALEIVGMHLPAGVANLLVAPLNPLVRADRLPIRLRFSDVTIDDGMMTILATAP